MRRFLCAFCVFAGVLLAQIGPGPGGGGGSGGSPGGSSGQIQYNNSSAFGGTNGLNYVPGALSVTQVPGPTTPATYALAGTGAGNVDNGRHVYTITFVTATGETEAENVFPSCSAGPPDAFVTVADKTVNGKVSITNIPLGGTGVIARRIYRSVGNTPSPNGGFEPCSITRILTTINDNTTTTYVDNIADSALGGYFRPNFMNTTGIGLSASDGSGGFLPSSLNNYGGPIVINGINFVNGFNGLRDDFSVFPGNMNSQVVYDGNNFGAANTVLYMSTRMSAQIPDGVAVSRFNYDFAALNATVTPFNAGTALLGIDVDSATDQSPNPWIMSVYSGEDGSHFSGGFSTAGGFFGINMRNAPPSSIVQFANAVYPARTLLSLQAAASQTGDMFHTLANDGTTVQPFHVDANGIPGSSGRTLAQINALSPALTDGSQPYCSDCTVTSGIDDTCTSGGSGASVVRVNGILRCRI